MTPATVWLTGLPASGKSTLARALQGALAARGHPALRLDGDEVRRGLSADLGFDDASRLEQARRCAEVAALAQAQGFTAVVALVSPWRAARDAARALHRVRGLRFVEVHLTAPLAVCEARDLTGLYRRARAGQASQVTGLDAPYEAPTSPELELPPELAVPEATARLLALLEAGS